MDDLLGVEVEHARCNLPGTAHHLVRENLDARSQVVVECPSRAVLQDDAIARRSGAHTSAWRGKEMTTKFSLFVHLFCASL